MLSFCISFLCWAAKKIGIDKPVLIIKIKADINSYQNKYGLKSMNLFRKWHIVEHGLSIPDFIVMLI